MPSRSEKIGEKYYGLSWSAACITRNFFQTQNARLINKSIFELRGVYNGALKVCKLQGWVSLKLHFLCHCISFLFVVLEIYNFAYTTIRKSLHWGLLKLVIHKVLPTNCYIQNISIHNHISFCIENFSPYFNELKRHYSLIT